jgi:hypothetical protein
VPDISAASAAAPVPDPVPDPVPTPVPAPAPAPAPAKGKKQKPKKSEHPRQKRLSRDERSRKFEEAVKHFTADESWQAFLESIPRICREVLGWPEHRRNKLFDDEKYDIAFNGIVLGTYAYASRGEKIRNPVAFAKNAANSALLNAYNSKDYCTRPLRACELKVWAEDDAGDGMSKTDKSAHDYGGSSTSALDVGYYSEAANTFGYGKKAAVNWVLEQKLRDASYYLSFRNIRFFWTRENIARLKVKVAEALSQLPPKWDSIIKLRADVYLTKEGEPVGVTTWKGIAGFVGLNEDRVIYAFEEGTKRVRHNIVRNLTKDMGEVLDKKAFTK